MRLVVLTDLHGNLPALEAALTEIDRDGYDLLAHTGDAVGIGPFPAECLDRLLGLKNALLLTGNHDAWFASGLPDLSEPKRETASSARRFRSFLFASRRPRRHPGTACPGPDAP